MSGYHWSDDPVLARAADCRDAWRAHAKQLDFHLISLDIHRDTYLASCPKCMATVYVGDIGGYDVPDDGGDMQAHLNWHEKTDGKA